ncbi:MAG: metal-dependent transcriptional regulator [Dehalococcoidia bacterium]|jgi:DtxR family Mn-dependent transcriptional regulator
MEGERTEEYLEAIYKRQGKETPVSTSSLAADLGVSQPAVTDMLRTLENKGLIDYKVGKGVALTHSGEEMALVVIRRHRLWERFLTDVLGMKWDKVHEEACRLEHATSIDIEKGLSSILGNIDTCPHGHSIPDEKGNIKPEKTTPLSQFHSLQTVRILTVDDKDPKLLRRIEKLGLRPGAVVTILKRNKDGSLDIELEKEKFTLDNATASILTAEPALEKLLATEEAEIALGKLSPGESAVIKTCGGGRESLGRCLSLGFTPGSVIKMVENYSRGPVLVKVHDTEVAIGRQLAEKISVARREVA